MTCAILIWAVNGSFPAESCYLRIVVHLAAVVKGCQTSARIIMPCQVITPIRVQMLDKPRGVKPRGVAGLFQDLSYLWGF